MTLTIDTHLHFWDLAIYPRTEWIEDKPLLYRNYLPAHVKSHNAQALYRVEEVETDV